MLRGCVILVTATGLVMGQAMVQHAVSAAAGGAAAAAGSKKVADSLEKILGGAANTAGTAAAAPAAQAKTPAPTPTTGRRGKPSPFEPQVNRAGGTELTPSVQPGTVETTISGEALPNNPWSSRRPASQGAVPAFSPFVSNDAPVVGRGARRNAAQVSETMAAPAVPVQAPVIAAVVIPPPPPPVRATPEKFASIQLGASYETILSQLGTPASKIEMMDDGKVLESLRIEANGSKLGTILLVNGVVTSIEPVVR